MATSEPLVPEPKKRRKRAKAKDGLHALKGGGWRFRIYTFGSKEGPRKSFTLPRGTTRAEAEAYVAAEKAKAKALAGKPFLQHFTVRQAWEDLVSHRQGSGAADATVASVARAGTHVLPLLGSRRLADLRGADVETYQRTRLEQGAAPATINLETTWLRAAIRRSLRARWIFEDPLPAGTIKQVAGEPKNVPPLTPLEWARFKDVVNDEEKWQAYAVRLPELAHRPAELHRERLRTAAAAFRFALLTGSRISEVWGLTWSAVDLEAGRVTLAAKKTHMVKVLPLTATTRAILESRPRGTPAAPVFTRSGEAWDNDSLRAAFGALAKASGLRPGPSPHTLKHTCASWLTGEGVPEPVVAVVLSHRKATMTQRYIHPSDPVLLEALEKLEKVENSVRAPFGRHVDSGIASFRPQSEALSVR